MMNREVIIIGSGNSGRGMLGELFFNDNWKIVFADINVQLTDLLKKTELLLCKKDKFKNSS